MGDGLDLAVIERECGFEESLTVACGCGAGDDYALGQTLVELAHSGLSSLDGVALVARIVGIEELTLTTDEGDLGGGGACVDAEEGVAAILRQLGTGDNGAVMACYELVVLVAVGKEGGESGHFKCDLDTLGESGGEGGDKGSRAEIGLEGGAHSGEEV